MGPSNRIVASLFVLLSWLLLAGCLAKFPSISSAPTDEQVVAEGEKDTAAPSLDRVEKSASQADQPRRSGAEQDRKPDKTKPVHEGSKQIESKGKTEPKDEATRVRTAALELARSLGDIKRAKVCYVDKDKEWWAVFYQDMESAADVRQFFWNATTEKFEPFLVLKRIPQAKIDSDFKKEESGKICAELPLPSPPPQRRDDQR